MLEEIGNPDGPIICTPNYLGDVSAGIRALYEHLIFQSLTCKTEGRGYNQKQIPVPMAVTGNTTL